MWWQRKKIKIAAAISFHKEFESSYVMLRYWISATCTQLMPCSTSEPQCTEQQYGVKVLRDVVELWQAKTVVKHWEAGGNCTMGIWFAAFCHWRDLVWDIFDDRTFWLKPRFVHRWKAVCSNIRYPALPGYSRGSATIISTWTCCLQVETSRFCPNICFLLLVSPAIF